jgi:putative ABC transport system substrate-binding protein
MLPDLIAELIARKPDVIIAEATPAVAAAQKATSVIPIVMAPATDPIGSGFVQSFRHPGGNITGVANMFSDLTAKTLDIVRLVFPSAKKIGVLISNNPRHPALLEVARAAAATIGIAAEGFIARNPEDIEAAFVQMKEANCEVVYILADPPRPVLPPIALKFALPTIFQVSSYVPLGGLMSYGRICVRSLPRQLNMSIAFSRAASPPTCRSSSRRHSISSSICAPPKRLA